MFFNNIPFVLLIFFQAILGFVLLLVYNCSGLFISLQVKMSSRSRKKAAKRADKSAAARERWKLAKELILRHEVRNACLSIHLSNQLCHPMEF
jgi:hypothetical protein